MNHHCLVKPLITNNYSLTICEKLKFYQATRRIFIDNAKDKFYNSNNKKIFAIFKGVLLDGGT